MSSQLHQINLEFAVFRFHSYLILTRGDAPKWLVTEIETTGERGCDVSTEIPTSAAELFRSYPLDYS